MNIGEGEAVLSLHDPTPPSPPASAGLHHRARPDPLRERDGGRVPLREHRPGGLHGARRVGRRRSQRHLGLGGPGRQHGVRDHGPDERDRLRQHFRPPQPVPRGRRAHRNDELPVAGRQGLRRPRLHRLRGRRPRHAGRRSDPARRHPQPPGDPPAQRGLHRVRQRTQHRHQPRDRAGLRCGHRHLRRRTAHRGHQRPDQPDSPRLLRCGRVYPRCPGRLLHRPRHGVFRQGNRLLFQREHPHHRRRHRCDGPRPDQCHRLLELGLYSPGLADRGPQIRPARR